MSTVTIVQTQIPNISVVQVLNRDYKVQPITFTAVSAGYIQSLAGGMWEDTSSVNVTYNNITQTINAAVRVDNYTLLIDGTGNKIYSPNGLYHEAAYSGLNLSGIDESSGRILTLPNTNLTKSIAVWMDGIFMHPGVLVTISHLASNSTIEFIGQVLNSQSIWVVWYD